MLYITNEEKQTIQQIAKWVAENKDSIPKSLAKNISKELQKNNKDLCIFQIDKKTNTPIVFFTNTDIEKGEDIKATTEQVVKCFIGNMSIALGAIEMFSKTPLVGDKTDIKKVISDIVYHIILAPLLDNLGTFCYLYELNQFLDSNLQKIDLSDYIQIEAWVNQLINKSPEIEKYTDEEE